MKPVRLAGLALLVASVSCSDTAGPGRPLTELETARELWQAQNLHTYAFTVQRGCFCANTHRLYVFVLSDTVAGAFDLETGEWTDSRLGLTVDELFTFIEDAINRPARLIRAEYDGAKGFPTEIDYDGDAQIADDELSYRISDVHPVSPSGD